MNKAIFNVSKMDCPSEEQMIRMKLEVFDCIKNMEFDIAGRTLVIIYDGDIQKINEALSELNFGSKLISKEENVVYKWKTERGQGKLLITVLLINFIFFIIEALTGFFSNSMGLVADGLDMLADAFVYGLSLYAVGHAISKKKKIAKLSGYFQMILAFAGFAEVIRRFAGFGDTPLFNVMIIVSIFALLANVISLIVLQKSKSDEVHMKASMIFTSNDIIANFGVIVAGVVVYFTSSKFPDLVIGAFVFLLVLKGAFRILKIAK